MLGQIDHQQNVEEPLVDEFSVAITMDQTLQQTSYNDEPQGTKNTASLLTNLN